jgi:hypothetical protein
MIGIGANFQKKEFKNDREIVKEIERKKTIL